MRLPNPPAPAMSEIPTGEVVDLLVALVRNACVNDGTPDSGHEHRSVETLAAYLGSRGEIVEPHPGRQSVIYRVPGFDPAAPRLLLIPHLDVVPADEGSWTHDPFAAEIADGFVWGRGTLDMLNVTAAMAAVFKRHLDGAAPRLPGDLILAAVADEEAGGRLGAEHLVEHRWDAVGCEYLLTEIAAPPFPSPDGPVVPVTVAEKGPAWRRIRAVGESGHGSQPYARHNALVPLAAAMGILGSGPSPVHIADEWRTFVAQLPIDDALRARLLDPDGVDEAIDVLAISDPAFARWVHACTHLTVSPNVIRSGTKTNTIPGEAVGDVDSRILPGQDEESVDDHFRKVLGPSLWDDLEVERVMDFPATRSEPSGHLWEAIADAAEDVTGTRRLVPAMTPATTDARFFRARGVPAYGVGWFDDSQSFAEMLSSFHGVDERVSVASVGMTANFLMEVVRHFGDRTKE